MNGFGIAAMIFCIIVVWVAGINVVKISFISLCNAKSIITKTIILATMIIIMVCCILSTYIIGEFYI